MNEGLEGRRVHVTGAGQGLGRAIAAAFAAHGARVMCSDVDEAAAKATADTIGNDARSVRCNVTDSSEMQAAIDATVDAFGGLDVMVNNAGVEVVKPMMEISEDEFDQLMGVNVKGVFLGTKAAVPALVASGGGSIVNLASVAGYGGVPLFSIYCASKGAVVRFTESCAGELRDANIRVNCVCPAFIATAMVERLVPTVEAATGVSAEDLVAQKQARLGTPEEVAESVLFLASDDASFITGAKWVLDNALSASCM